MRVSVCALVLVAVVGCYGTPRHTGARRGHDGGMPTRCRRWMAAGSGRRHGAATRASDGGSDAAPTTCDAGSPPARPEARCGPMRGAYTGSLHAPPRLRRSGRRSPGPPWRQPAAPSPTKCKRTTRAAPGALDACAFPSPELDATGVAALTYAPTADLKVSTTPRSAPSTPGACAPATRAPAAVPGPRSATCTSAASARTSTATATATCSALSNRGIEVYLGSSQFDVSAPSLTDPVQQLRRTHRRSRAM